MEAVGQILVSFMYFSVIYSVIGILQLCLFLGLCRLVGFLRHAEEA